MQKKLSGNDKKYPPNIFKIIHKLFYPDQNKKERTEDKDELSEGLPPYFDEIEIEEITLI